MYLCPGWNEKQDDPITVKMILEKVLYWKNMITLHWKFNDFNKFTLNFKCI